VISLGADALIFRPEITHQNGDFHHETWRVKQLSQKKQELARLLGYRFHGIP
jgi:hypothetical protein